MMINEFLIDFCSRVDKEMPVGKYPATERKQAIRAMLELLKTRATEAMGHADQKGFGLSV